MAANLVCLFIAEAAVLFALWALDQRDRALSERNAVDLGSRSAIGSSRLPH